MEHAAALPVVASAPPARQADELCGPDGILCENESPAEVRRAKERLLGQEPKQIQAQGGSDWPAARQPDAGAMAPPHGVPKAAPATAPAEGSIYGAVLNPDVEKLLLTSGRRIDSFAPDFSAALADGRVTPGVLARYLDLESNALVRMVWGIAGFRERLLADPSFPVKVGIECGIGVFTKVTAERTKRGDNFWREIDFVGANVLMAVIADFMLTWLPAPTLSYAVAAPSGGALLSLFAHCPDNAFQRVQPGSSRFTVLERCGAIVRNGGKLLGVGFSASMLGVGITNTLIALRQRIDTSWAPPNTPQNVLQTSGAYGLYMAVSSNLRYQILAGIVEERGIETAFAGQTRLCNVLSFVVRTTNTFIGSLLWLDFVRLLGMQQSDAGDDKGDAPPAQGGNGDGVATSADLTNGGPQTEEDEVLLPGRRSSSSTK